MRNLLWRVYLSRFDAMLAYSSVGAEGYVQAGMERGRVFTAFNAVASAPRGAPPEREPPAERIRILFVGRLQSRKRVDLLLQAASRLTPKPSVTIVGDGPVRAGLEQYAAQVFPSAEFKGALVGEALDQQFLEADLFVLPGTGGLAVQQAMAHGLPVMVAEGDGSQHDLVSSENGWLLQTGDGESLFQALREATSQPESLRTKGIASFRRVQDSFNIERMAETFVKALNLVCGAE